MLVVRIALVLLVASGCREGYSVDDDVETPEGCGDGVVDPDEACDDGNENDNDGCRNNCAIARCGDGVLRETVEECDDANDVDDDSCTTTCVSCDISADGTFGRDTECFSRHNSPTDDDGADSVCDAIDAELAQFVDQAENDAVVAGLDISAPVWFGLTYSNTNSRWQWRKSPTALAFENWAPGGFPMMLDSDYSGQLQPDGTWIDVIETSNAAVICQREESGWITDESTGQAFRRFSSDTSFDLAVAECEREGGNLATIVSASEQLTVDRLSSSNSMWVGARTDGSANLLWITGEPPGITNWGSGYPEADECVIVVSSGAWETRPCDTMRDFACELD